MITNIINQDEQFFRELIDILPYPVAYVNMNGIFQFGNKKFKSLHGRDIEKKSIFDVLDRERAERLMITIQDVLRTKRAITYVDKACQDLMPSKFFRIEVLPLFSSSIVRGLMIVEKNITSQIEAELELQQKIIQLEKSRDHAQSYLENIVSHFPGYVYWKDIEGRILGDNLSHAKMAGFTNQIEIIGKTDYDLPWKDQADQIRMNDLEVMTSQKNQVFEESATLEDGSKSIFLTIKAPLYNAFQQVEGIIGISIDITDRKEMEEYLKQSRTAAEAANQAKTEFLRNMEHQLRTPFSGIYSMIAYLAENESNSDKAELLNMTYLAAKEFLELLNDILEFSRHQIDRPVILEKKFNLLTIIEKIIVMEKATAAVKQLSLDFEYEASTPRILIGDPTRIQRIMMNLVNNAIKFTEEGYIKVTVSLVKQLNQKEVIIKIIVSDTGVGISEDKHSFIYEKFSRLSPANYNKYKGAGLGLYTVKQLLEELEGEIDLISAPHKGSSFICTIPFKCPLIAEVINEI